jgi:integrase
LAAWLAVPGIRGNPAGPLFPAARSPRGMGRDGFNATPMTTRAVEKLIGRFGEALDFDPSVTVHSLRVTALTTARERGSDIIDLQEFAGHADPRTTHPYPVTGSAQQKPGLRAAIQIPSKHRILPSIRVGRDDLTTVPRRQRL